VFVIINLTVTCRRHSRSHQTGQTLVKISHFHTFGMPCLHAFVKELMAVSICSGSSSRCCF